MTSSIQVQFHSAEIQKALRTLGSTVRDFFPIACHWLRYGSSPTIRGMSPAELVREWVRRFNAADVDGVVALYAPDAVNHQVVTAPLVGRDAIRKMFEIEFGRAKMDCQLENLLESGDWAILERTDPIGLRGCGFFQVKNDQIVFQRGYFDQLTFFRARGIPIPENYLDC